MLIHAPDFGSPEVEKGPKPKIVTKKCGLEQAVLHVCGDAGSVKQSCFDLRGLC